MIDALAATDEPFANLLRDHRSSWVVVHDYGMGALLVAAEDEGGKPTPRGSGYLGESDADYDPDTLPGKASRYGCQVDFEATMSITERHGLVF